MLIGFAVIVGLVVLLFEGRHWSLITTFAGAFPEGQAPKGQPPSIASDALHLVAAALAGSAAVELAYTLFTRGPDEALEPVLVAIAAAILLQLGRVEQFDYKAAIAVLLYVFALVAAFWARHRFLDDDD